jgi:excisionase family DNA binding protein
VTQTAPHRTNELLSVAQVAELLSVRLGVVRSWVTSGQMPSVRLVGGRRRIHIRDAHPPATPETRSVRTGEAARLLGISPYLLRRQALAGLLPHRVTLGGHLVFDLDELLALPAERRVTHPIVERQATG